jgi:hypothetical protein
MPPAETLRAAALALIPCLSDDALAAAVRWIASRLAEPQEILPKKS